MPSEVSTAQETWIVTLLSCLLLATAVAGASAVCAALLLLCGLAELLLGFDPLYHLSLSLLLVGSSGCGFCLAQWFLGRISFHEHTRTQS